jgi:predicted DNA-binding transcriptional regulator AlpA
LSFILTPSKLASPYFMGVVMSKRFILDASGLPTGGEASPMAVLDKILQEMPQATYIRQAGLLPGVLPISPATLWRWVKIGTFPKPHRLSARVTAWLIADVRTWLISKRQHEILTAGIQ